VSTTEYQSALAIELEGDVELAAGRIHSALARYRQASAMVPENDHFVSRVLQMARTTNDDQLILECLRRLLELDPFSPSKARDVAAQEKKMQPSDMN